MTDVIDYNYVVGNVIEVDGLAIRVLMHENTNVLNYFYNGEKYKGVTINSFVGIIRGPYKIVAKVRKENLEDLDKTPGVHSYKLERFRRIVELQVVGWFSSGAFTFGIKCFPMIYNEVVLLTEKEIGEIFNSQTSKRTSLHLGQIMQTETDFSIDWSKLFNTHIGLFGNTGSGKSNTLCKLYGELFRMNEVEIEEGKYFRLDGTSKFLVMDFNGEYLKENTLCATKSVKYLSTRGAKGSDKICLSAQEFWSIETLSILFSATEKTQKPFLQNLLDFFDCKAEFDVDVFIQRLAGAFTNVYEGNNDKEMIRLLRDLYKMVGFQQKDEFYVYGEDEKPIPWSNAQWHSGSNTYYIPPPKSKDEIFYLNKMTQDEMEVKKADLIEAMKHESCRKRIQGFSPTDRLIAMAICQLIYGLRCRHLQFDHINPLLQRIRSQSKFIDKIISIEEEEPNKDAFVTVISLRDCNLEAKKMIPMLIAKQEYYKHRERHTGASIENTFHLIIDEAHNILSQQAQREEESWKDYRLDVFEEMIKEGRKFGFYLAIASQRPHDISPTIISQLHNFFLHRLVNDRDLQMINNTINSLDSVSKHYIPTLAPGQCVVTGTAFDLPVLVQIDQLPTDERPSSEDAELEQLWLRGEDKMNWAHLI